MKNSILFILFIFFLIPVNGQDMQSLIPHVPTSPQAEAFQKFGDHAINYSTGIPDISIPLYEINHRGYTLPMMLKYNPLPLKPGYNYDVYGHGWGLSVNSSVSRSIEYLPDEQKDFEIEDPPNELYHWCPECLTNKNYAHDKFNAVLPDGSSFNFVIQKNASGEREYIISDNRHVKISCSISSVGPKNISSFTIKDEKGIEYIFSEGDRPYLGPYTDNYYSNVSWNLSQINLPHTPQPIMFNYDYTIQSEGSGANVCQDARVTVGKIWAESCFPCPIFFTEPSYQPHYYRMKLLSSISYGDVDIILDYEKNNETEQYNYVEGIEVSQNSSTIRDIQLDMTKYDISTHCGIFTLAKLDKVTTIGSDASETPKVYECEYETPDTWLTGTDHWGYLNNGNPDFVADFNFWVPLLTNYIGDLPDGLSIIENSDESTFPHSTKLKMAPTSSNNREPAGPGAHGVISRIKYPTGGYTDFEFEQHAFLTSTDLNGDYIHDLSDRILAYAGGFRINSMTTYADASTKAKVKKFRYGVTYSELSQTNNNFDSQATNYPNIQSGIGEAVVDPNVITYMDFQISEYKMSDVWMPEFILGTWEGESWPFPSGSNIDDFAWFCNFSPVNFRRVLGGRPSVLYPEVTVYHGDIGDTWNEYTPENTIGKTVYKYDIYITNADNEQVFFEPLRYIGHVLHAETKPYLYHKIQEKADYKFDGSDYTLVEKEVNDWQQGSTYFLDHTARNIFPVGKLVSDVQSITGIPSTFYYIYKVRTIKDMLRSKQNRIGYSKLKAKSTITYDESGNDITNWVSYGYTSHGQIEYKSTGNSDDKVKKTTYSYPDDDDTDPIVQEMFTENMISTVLEKTIRMNSDIISGSKVDYNTFGSNDIIMPETTYELEVDESGNQYIETGTILDYTDNGNPIEYISKDEVNTSYLWGYNDRYIIVKAENLSSGTLNSAVSTTLSGLTQGSYSGISDLEDFLEDVEEPYTSKALLKEFNRNLRSNSSLSEAMVFTYTHDPLIGITSETDPNGVTTYYQYDGFGRLKTVRDDDGNIIKDYTYNYK